MKKFEARFEGPSNAGLRAEIRRVVSDDDSPDVRCPAEKANAVRLLARRVALTESGRHTLELVAQDYASVES